MNPLLQWAIKFGGLVLAIKADGLTEDLKAHLDALFDELRPMLPVKEDGSAWTSEEIDALVAEHFGITSDIRARHQH